MVDVSINGAASDNKTKDSWKTIVIGGMGQGGACRNMGTSCSDCVKTPITNLGYSSYFALDVTDPTNPTLLWEFSDPELGFSTSGPTVVRIGDSTKKGKWFALFASGPTGPIDTTYHQFMGKSDQNFKIFVVDLKTGVKERTIDTGIPEAFGGSFSNGTLDSDRGDSNSSGFYSDNVIYVGYTKKSGTTWTKGGVYRIITKESQSPGDWIHSKVIDDTGPVTSAITKLQDRRHGNLWLYFGTGRFFYKLDAKTSVTLDSADDQQAIYGIKEPCYSVTTNTIDTTCSSSVSAGFLSDRTTTISTVEPAIGWKINLEPTNTSTGSKAERVITDPLAIFSGVVFFTSLSPSADLCALGGNTFIWAVNYSTGAQPSALLGKALLQVSTGEIKELTLATAFSEKGGRRSVAISGVPPRGQGLAVLVAPRPLRRILHIKEK